MAPWQAEAQREWGATATWIKGAGQYAVLHPCSQELTVTLCETLAEAKKMKAFKCGSACTRAKHSITDLGTTLGKTSSPA